MQKPGNPKKADPAERRFEPGDILFKEGDPAHSMYIIQEGLISIRKQKRDSYVEIAKLHSKEVLGELSFFDRGKRSATAMALTDVRALEIEFEAMDKIYSVVPPYIQTIMTAIAVRLRKANEIIKRLQHNEDLGTELVEPTEDEAKLAELDAPQGGGDDSSSK